MIERVESSSHGTEGNGIECQTSEVVCYFDGSRRSLTGPFHDQLGRDIVHIIEHAANHEWAECGHQDSVSNGPVFFAVVCCEETIMSTISNFFQTGGGKFDEAIFVANFID